MQDDFEGFMSIVNSRSMFPSLFEKVSAFIRDVRGGLLFRGAGRGGAKVKIHGAGRGEGENPRGGAGRGGAGRKSAQINQFKNFTKVRKI